jgi:hypothetical protein
VTNEQLFWLIVLAVFITFGLAMMMTTTWRRMAIVALVVVVVGSYIIGKAIGA